MHQLTSTLRSGHEGKRRVPRLPPSAGRRKEPVTVLNTLPIPELLSSLI
jgi:hypothetical protein